MHKKMFITTSECLLVNYLSLDTGSEAKNTIDIEKRKISLKYNENNIPRSVKTICQGEEGKSCTKN